ncbi:MAG: VWA domain-containing protein [Gemmatimonadales bacterium]
MSEPEEVILDGAHFATEYAARLWRRNTKGAPMAGLADSRRRLETLLAALYPSPLPIVSAESPAQPTLFGRLARRTPRHLVDLRALPSTDGVRIRLPPLLDAGAGDAAARYRLLAVVQAARAARGTPLLLPDVTEPDVRDLYLLSESAASDREIVAALPGLAPALYRWRLVERESRPRNSLLTSREREVERLMRIVLASSPEMNPAEVPFAPTPTDSLAWARATAALLAPLGGRYRGLRAVATWGRIDPFPAAAPRRAPAPGDTSSLVPTAAKRVRALVRRPRVRDAGEDEDDARPGMWMIQLDDPKEHVEDPMGLVRPADRDAEANADDLADSVSELAEARLVDVPGPPTEVLVSEDPPDRRAVRGEPSVGRAGIAYPEWDWRIAGYHERRAVVHEVTAPRGDAAWANDVLQRHAREVAAVRRQFERLRARRVRLLRQLDGDDLDLNAFVSAWANARAGSAADDRMYECVRPGRREAAISLLVDISGSTDSWIADHRRVIDVEKEALVLTCEALDALDDRYNVLAFSGEGPRSVTVRSVKAFGERNGVVVRERIAGLEHDRYTRLGAAVRHATAALSREHARHRLLLVLSDGKPNDVDEYEGRYGVEDARQAVAEARLQGLSPFCLTVDREAPIYLPRIFGPGAYAVLRRAERLPAVLVDVVRQLLRQ